MMKKVYLMMCIFAFALSSFSATGKDSPSKPIIIRTEKTGTGIDRTEDTYVYAYLETSSNSLVLECYNLGTGDAYIIDSNNTVISHFHICDGMSSVDAPNETGVYYIVIITDFIYGEGVFEL